MNTAVDEPAHAQSRRESPEFSQSTIRVNWQSAILILVLAGMALVSTVPIIAMPSYLWVEFWYGRFNLQQLYDLWQTSAYAVLPLALLRSTILVIVVGIFSTALGTGLALFTMCGRIKGALWIDRLSILPLVMPAYLLAIAYVDLFPQAHWIKSQYGLIALLVVGTFPYAYLIARPMMPGLAILIDAGLTSNQQWRHIIVRLIIPTLWPSMVLSATVIGLETLGEYGASQFLGNITLSTYIVNLWVGKAHLNGALVVSMAVMALIIFIMVIGTRKNIPVWSHTATRARPSMIISPLVQCVLWGVSVGLFIAGVALPVYVFMPSVDLLWTLTQAPLSQTLTAYEDTFAAFGNGITLAGLTMMVVSFVGVLVFWGVASTKNAQFIPHTRTLHRSITIFANTISLGYVTPATVIAMGTLVFAVTGWRVLHYFSLVEGNALTIGLWVLVWACVTRFLAIGVQMAKNTAHSLPTSIFDAAQFLSQWQRMRVLIAAYAPTALISGLLVMIEVYKDLPLNLLLAPFDFVTPAVRLFSYAQGEQFNSVAIDGLSLVVVGIIQMTLILRRYRW